MLGGQARDFLWPNEAPAGTFCGWCRQEMTGLRPFYAPEGFLPPSTFCVGPTHYCHPSCALAYVLSTEPPPDHIFWTQNLAHAAGYDGIITPSPHWHALIDFGGSLDRDTFEAGRVHNEKGMMDPVLEKNSLCASPWSLALHVDERTRRRCTRHELHLQLPINQLFQIIFHEGRAGKLPLDLEAVVGTNHAMSNLWALELQHHFGMYNVQSIVDQWGSRSVWGATFKLGADQDVSESTLAVLWDALQLLPEEERGSIPESKDLVHEAVDDDVNTSLYDKFIEKKGAPTDEERSGFETSSRKAGGISVKRSGGRAKKSQPKSRGKKTLFEMLMSSGGDDDPDPSSKRPKK